MKEVINTYKTDDSRINVVKNKNFILINDCYNSSYESLDNILSILENIDINKILIIGDIYELGKYNKKISRKIKDKINRLNNCEVLLMGNNMKKLKRKIRNSVYCDDFENLFSKIQEIDLNNNIILIKASHAMNFNNIYNYLITVDKNK